VSTPQKQRDDYRLHYDCNKQAARIAEELKEAKACLEMVDDTWARGDEEGQHGNVIFPISCQCKVH
jgi:hypothetical protein